MSTTLALLYVEFDCKRFFCDPAPLIIAESYEYVKLEATYLVNSNKQHDRKEYHEQLGADDCEIRNLDS